MFKLLGVVFLIAGAGGFSFCICRDRKLRLLLLKEEKYMYELIQNEIRYTALPLPEIFQSISDKVKEPFGSILKGAGEGMTWEQGEALGRVWQREVEKGLREMPFTGKQKEFLLRFPETMGLGESEGQAKALQRRIEELDGWITQLEKEGREQNRVIMSLGIAGGLLLSILLF